jgi:retron-type reverse transcriptase
MKRIGQLMDAIAAPDNLRLAFWKAAKGKRTKADCRAFRENLELNLGKLRGDLLSGQVGVGDYRYFTIHDPKERTICAASFRERVLHHALMNVCEPVLERAAIFDSYACRKGKGRLAAIERAQGFARQHAWFLKMDVRKYFDSIDHSILTGLLARKFKDRAVLELLGSIIGSYGTAPGRGLPIGNLTSQHFANFYLGPLDRFVKEDVGRRAYVRYMDDFVVWGGDADDLRQVRDRTQAFLAQELSLELKSNTALNRTARGMDFLGYRLFPHTVRLARRSKVRFARKFRRCEQTYLRGQWSELHLQQRMLALLAFVMPADSLAYRRHVLERFACLPDGEGQSTLLTSERRRQGVVAMGLEPGDPRWQLEQQRDQLPHGEPQQQLAGQQEQQHRVPVRPAPSSIPLSGTDPAAILSCEGVRAQANRESPPGVSSPAGLRDRTLRAGDVQVFG